MRKFIITCHSRTGASLLVDALAQNPKVMAIGELFMPDLPERRRQCSIAGRAFEDGEDATAFVRDWVFAERGFAAVGFKLMYYDGRPGAPGEAARRHLIGDRDVGVVHLWRADLLARSVSDRLAQLTNRWSLPRGAARPDEVPPIVIDPGRLRVEFDWVTTKMKETRLAFASHPILELEYQRDVSDGFAATMAKLWKFLEVDAVPAEPRLEKQASLPPSRQIANFGELRDHFAETSYASFFES